MRRADRGSVTVETLLLTPVLMALVFFAVFAGRAGETLAQVRHAADQGARAGVRGRAALRESVARDAALAALAASGRSCRETSIGIRVARDGGLEILHVSVACAIDRTGLALLDPSARLVVAESSEVVDRWRAEE